MLGRKHNFKSARLRRKRRKVFIGRMFFVFICLAVLWGTVFWLSGLAAVNIRSVEISGAASVSPNEVAAGAQKFLTGRYFFTLPRTNIFFYPKGGIEKNILESFPTVENVDVGFINFHSIKISLTERQAGGLWCEQTEAPAAGASVCYLLDGNGLIFAPVPALASSSPAFIKFYSAAPKPNPIGQNYASPAYFQSLLAFAKNLNTLGFPVSSFNERPDADFETVLARGSRLIFGRDADFSSVFSNFQTIVSDPSWGGPDALARIDYIDLRFGNKVFYKTK